MHNVSISFGSVSKPEHNETQEIYYESNRKKVIESSRLDFICSLKLIEFFFLLHKNDQREKIRLWVELMANKLVESMVYRRAKVPKKI